MKPTLAIIALILAATAFCGGQQITMQPTTVWTVPTVNWSGADAQVIAAQMLTATNSAGGPVLNVPGFVPGDMYIIIHMTVDANTNLQSISISGHQ